jgi:hypothetical protein
MLGVFSYSSAKASRLALSSKPRGMAYMFVMHVAEELQKWPEADLRTRLWVSTRFRLRCTSLVWHCGADRTVATRRGQL